MVADKAIQTITRSNARPFWARSLLPFRFEFLMGKVCLEVPKPYMSTLLLCREGYFWYGRASLV